MTGCGRVGITAAVCNARRVELTDTSETLTHLRLNLDENIRAGVVTGDAVEASVLEWGSSVFHGEAEVVLISDCTYWQHLHQRLIGSMKRLAAHNPATTFLLAHHWRRPDAEAPFFSALESFCRVRILAVENEAGEAIERALMIDDDDWKGMSQAFKEGEIVLMELRVREGQAASVGDQEQRGVSLEEPAEEEDTAALLERIRLLESDLESIAAED